MSSETIRVVLDANVLFQFTLRDTLLRAAEDEMFQVYWSEKILDETTDSLVRKSRVSEDQATRLRNALHSAFGGALVSGFDELVPSMPNEEKDRHVAAVAVKAQAQKVITCNLKDFDPMPKGIVAQSPDDFLTGLLEAHPDKFVPLLQRQANELTNPPVTLQGLLDGLGKSVPKFKAAMQKMID